MIPIGLVDAKSKIRWFGSEHYKLDRPVYKPSPWAEGDLADKMRAVVRLRVGRTAAKIPCLLRCAVCASGVGDSSCALGNVRQADG